jgi:high-affinity K+ transport system ATPase subunit B
MLSLLFNPLGKYILIGGAVLMVLGGVYFKIRADAVAEAQATAQADALRRVQNAISSGDNAAVSPDRLLESDGHRRD